MSIPKKYMAASVPRFLRQSRLGYLPLNCVIGSRLIKGDTGNNLYFDIVMLPVHEFQRMRSNVGLQHVIAPAFRAGPEFTPGFVLSDAKEVVVPADELYPEDFARKYFLRLFHIEDTNATNLPIPAIGDQSSFAQSAYEYAARKKKL